MGLSRSQPFRKGSAAVSLGFEPCGVRCSQPEPTIGCTLTHYARPVGIHKNIVHHVSDKIVRPEAVLIEIGLPRQPVSEQHLARLCFETCNAASDGQFAAQAHEQMHVIGHEHAGTLSPMSVIFDRGELGLDSGGDLLEEQAPSSILGAESNKITRLTNRHTVVSECLIATARSVHGAEMDAKESASKLAAYA